MATATAPPTRTPKTGRPKRPTERDRDRRFREVQRAANLLKQVSDPTRLQVLLILDEGERCVTEICADLGIQSQPAVSHHLALLRHGGLIAPRRMGKNTFYEISPEGESLVKVVETLFLSIEPAPRRQGRPRREATAVTPEPATEPAADA
jgi:DNA-binding transcriptional ArsR family regulator